MASKNTKMYIESLHTDLEFKAIRLNDIAYIEKIHNDDISDKEFVLRVLYNQYEGEKISYEQFNKLQDGQIIKLGHAFLENNEIEINRSEIGLSFFSNFRKRVIENLNRLSNKLNKFVSDRRRLAEQELKSIQESLGPVLSQLLSPNYYFKEFDNALEVFKNNSPIFDEKIINDIEDVNSYFKSIAININKYLAPQIEYMVNWIENNNYIFDSYKEYWIDFENRFNIAQAKAAEVLRKYKWFFTPSLPMTLIINIIEVDGQGGRQDGAINHLYVDYFTKNNWVNLDSLVSRWKDIPLIESRYKIISDCIKTIKISKSKKINPANVMLPTLITQIDGLMGDFLMSIGLTYDSGNHSWVVEDTGVNLGNKKVRIFKENKPEVLPKPLDELATDILVNILFQKSFPGETLAVPFNFNRHKIIHGENTHYGRKDYLIRTFLILDLLSYIIENESKS